MNARRVWAVLRKDVALGPRSPVVLLAVALPLLLTAVFQLAFGSLLEPSPRMAVVDEGDSTLTAALAGVEGIELTVLDDATALRAGVQSHDYDAGLVLPAGFDEAVRSGAMPPLDLSVAGQSLASDRLILVVTTIDLVRAVEGAAPPVAVEVVRSGTEALPLDLRLVPVLMMYVLFIAGAFVPASSLVDERVNGTLTALLVTPATAREVLTAKACLGAGLALVMSVVTLLLNGALGSGWAQVLVVLVLGAAFSAMLGLVIGTLAADGAMLFTIVKASGLVLFGPVVFYLFPDWPQWIARLFPTFWMIDPIWRVSVLGETLADVWPSMLVAVVIMLALVPLVAALSRRMLRRIAAG